jgi:hypothetical protein
MDPMGAATDVRIPHDDDFEDVPVVQVLVEAAEGASGDGDAGIGRATMTASATHRTATS